MRFWNWFASLLLLPGTAYGAACCGGGFASPSVIAGDERAQATAQLTHSQTAAEVDAQGYWRSRRETGEALRFDIAHLLSDRWQAGVSTQVKRRRLSVDSSSGWGDTAMTLAYEVLPDWTYHPIRPKGIGWIQAVTPTGRSVHESRNPLTLDAMGRGFWSFSGGMLFTKSWLPWDAFLSFETHRGLARTFSENRYRPGWGGSAGGGGGGSLGQARLGIQLTWSWEDPVTVNGVGGATSRYATLAASGSWMFSDEWAASVLWSDQTIFGSPAQASLGRSVGFQLQRRWLR